MCLRLRDSTRGVVLFEDYLHCPPEDALTLRYSSTAENQ